jgi:hypothetical protein
MTKLLKVIKVTRTYVVIGEANSSNPHYWEKDFREVAQVDVGGKEVEVIEPLREPSLGEQAIWNMIEKDR